MRKLTWGYLKLIFDKNVSLSYIKISNRVASQVQTNDSRPGTGNHIWNTKQIMYLINVKYCNEHESDLFTCVLSSYSGRGRRRARTCYRRRTRTGTYTHSCRYHPLLFLLNTSASVPCRCERVPHMGRCWKVQQSETTCKEAYACTGLHISPDYINARIIRIPASCRSTRTLLYRVWPFQIPLTASKSYLYPSYSWL